MVNTHQSQSACALNDLIGHLIARDHNCLNNTINQGGVGMGGSGGDRARVCSSVLGVRWP